MYVAGNVFLRGTHLAVNYYQTATGVVAVKICQKFILSLTTLHANEFSVVSYSVYNSCFNFPPLRDPVFLSSFDECYESFLEDYSAFNIQLLYSLRFIQINNNSFTYFVTYVDPSVNVHFKST